MRTSGDPKYGRKENLNELLKFAALSLNDSSV